MPWLGLQWVRWAPQAIFDAIMAWPSYAATLVKVVVSRLPAAWLSAALLTSLMTPAQALAQTPAQVTIAPPAGALVTGQPVTLDVIAQGVHNLYGVELHLRYDPTVAQVEDADLQQAGLQLIPGSLLDPSQGIVVANQADNQAGTAVFAVTLLNPAPAVEGGGLLAQLTVVPLQPGVLRLELESVKLITRDMQTLDVSVHRLEVQVSGQAIQPESTDQAASGAPGPTPVSGAPPITSVPIWTLVLVALIVVSLPLAGVWFFFIREAK